MIDKREVIAVATAQSLRPDVVEKDYALDWVLAGIAQHPELRERWVFKGGTCLKKCFFKTYRFSEDLDFTILDDTHLNDEFLGNLFCEISEWIYDTCGLDLPSALHKFDQFTNPRGHPACQAKVAYRGPISPQSERQLPRIKLDLSADELLVLPPIDCKSTTRTVMRPRRESKFYPMPTRKLLAKRSALGANEHAREICMML